MFAGEVDLNTWYKPTIDRKILKDLSKRSNLKGIIDISIFGLALLFSGYLCYISWGTWWSVPALLLYGNIFYCKTISVNHETNHETYFKSRRLNKFFMRLHLFLVVLSLLDGSGVIFIITHIQFLLIKKFMITKIIVQDQQSL
jgi:fatty acid desaturase